MQSLSPTEDFYQYINHKWLNDPVNSIPDDYSSWGGFTKLYDDGLTNQINLVKNLTEPNLINQTNLNEEEQKITAIWKASSTRFTLWQEGKSDYNPIIKEINVLDKYFNATQCSDKNQYITNLADYLYYSQVNGISNVLDFDKGSDLLETNNIVLDLSTCGLSLPSRDYYFLDEFTDKRDLFKKHLGRVKNIIEQNTKLHLSIDFVDNIIEFETEIATYTMKPDQSRKYDEYFTNTTLTDLYKNLNDLTYLANKDRNYPEGDRHFVLDDDTLSEGAVFFEELYSLFDFRQRLTTNLDKYFLIDDKTRPNQHHITAYDGDAIRRCLSLIFTSSNQNKYRCFLTYKIIKGFYSFCSKELDEEFFNFYQRDIDGQLTQKPEAKRSIGTVNLLAGEMMGKLFVAKYFSEKDKTHLQILIGKVLGIMNTSINTNDWLTEPTKQKALEKLGKFTSKIGYPDKWKDYSEFKITSKNSLYDIYKIATKWSLKVDFFDKLNSKLDKTEWHMTPQTVNAYYSPNLNEIVFPAAILQPPFYHTSITTVLNDLDIKEEINIIGDEFCLLAANLGGIGAVIAHEITHGFDDQGRKFDSSGNLNNWWTDEDVTLFQEKCEKVANIAKKYQYQANVANKSSKIYHINPELTMGENLADLGGLSMSLKTLKTYLMDKPESILLATYRVFFKSWANIWKLNIRDDRKIMLLTCDPHAPCDFRGNLVKNFPEFYQAFDIKKEDKMYLSGEDRLVMW